MSEERHPTESELLQGAIRTIEEVLTPELQSAWAKTSAMGLVGQLRYALARHAADSLAAQDAELESCLNALIGEYSELCEVVSEVPATGSASRDLREQAGRLLVFALEHQSPGAEAVRTRLRPILTAHVEEDLAESGPMLQAFLVSGSVGSMS